MANITNIIINGLTSDYIDADRDGKITFSELFDYVIDEIKSNTAWRSGAPQKWEWNVNNRMRFIKEFFDDDVKTLIEHIKSLRIKKVKSENTNLGILGIFVFLCLAPQKRLAIIPRRDDR